MKLEPKFGHIVHKTKSTHYNTATPRLKWSWSQNLIILYTRQSLHTTTKLLQGSSEAGAKILVILYTRQSLHTTTQLLQGSSGAGAKIWLYYTQDKAYILQQSYSKALVKLEPKFWSYCTQDKAYTLQHSYSKAQVELEPKFSHFIHKTKRTHYNTATPRFKWSWSQNLVILYTRQSLHTTTKLLQGSSEAGAKIWSYYTQDKAYILQHSYSKAPVELEPKFGQIIHNTKPTYYNTATPRLQWSWSQNLVKLYTIQSLHTTTKLLQGSSGARAKIWSNYTTRLAYRLLQ